MRRLIIILFTTVLFSFITTPSYAHVGGGPPFLKVNDVYAQTNPYYQGEAAFNVMQDIAAPAYPVGKPIHFEIDTNNLLIPKEVADHSIFRWSIEKGQTFYDTNKQYQYGTSIVKTFDTPGSYLLVVEAHAATEYDFVVIDTIQLNIVSRTSYQLPKPTILIASSHNEKDPVTFSAITQFDPTVKSATYLWDLGNGKLQKGQTVTADYSGGQPLTYLFLRVIDDHGFVNDVGFDTWDTKGNIEFHPFGNMTSAAYKEVPLSTINGTKKPIKHSFAWLYVAIPLVVLLILIQIVLYQKNRKSD